MDFVDTLRKKIEVLEDGEYVPGLKAVLLHIETAFRHLSRGQDADDETAFTDAIYRTNQAFEGSVKVPLQGPGLASASVESAQPLTAD
jgi:hypothetical protein